MSTEIDGKEEKAGAAVYSKGFLAFYDLYVLTLSNSIAWKCPRGRLLEHYNDNVSANHLDIGPGTGWYLREAQWPTANPAVALMDLNSNSLDMTLGRLAGTGARVQTHVGSVLAPIDPAFGQFDSVAANFLFHCVPGSWAEKGKAFQYIADVTSDEGVFFGSTILARGIKQNIVAKALTSLYNSVLHTFHNTDDDLNGLTAALESAFEDVQIEIVGTVAIFAARKPRRIDNAAE
ncbi:class I SAM-dependent methyltransferase [Rhodococcus qingshengii]|uniref:SAM-dependent methyltransferase n=1 Tax=Rhodococcus qingshengii TaxID=334542 RepID=A0A2A5IY62_RHOSG|nr:class I SAM-dependent methyltransferase [Rhodococcus qingshengii]PCK22275.1 SAM-dependent methyltransferase [Rhodococcus qingshengii]